MELHTTGLTLLLQSRHEAVRREVTIFRKVNAARDIHRHAGVELRERFGIENFRGYAELIGMCGVSRFIVECVLSFAEHHETALHETEVVVRQRSEFLEAR